MGVLLCVVIIIWTILVNYGNLTNGDIIEIHTNYGNFYYKLYDKKIINETETYKLNIQKNEEILMIYTCYPFSKTSHTDKRYVIYAKKV